MGKTPMGTDKTGLNLVPIKGKCTPLATPTGVEKIKHVFSFESPQKLLPFYLFETKVHSYIGITLARQSSDFLVLLAKKTIAQYKSSHNATTGKFFVMQYQLPKDYASVKLIVLSVEDAHTEILSITHALADIQSLFHTKLTRLVDSLD